MTMHSDHVHNQQPYSSGSDHAQRNEDIKHIDTCPCHCLSQSPNRAKPLYCLCIPPCQNSHLKMLNYHRWQNAEHLVASTLQGPSCSTENKEKSSLYTDKPSLQDAQKREELWGFLAPLLCSLVQHSDEGIVSLRLVEKLRLIMLSYTTPEERKQILLQHRTNKIS